MNNESRDYGTIGRIYGLSLRAKEKNSKINEILQRADALKELYENEKKDYKEELIAFEKKIDNSHKNIIDKIDSMQTALNNLSEHYLLSTEIIKTASSGNLSESIDNANKFFIEQQHMILSGLRSLISKLENDVASFNYNEKINNLDTNFKNYIEMIKTCSSNIFELNQGYAEGEAIKLAFSKKDSENN